MRPICAIKTQESPREILAADFKSLRGELPIRGGWGYSKEDACVIDKNDPSVDSLIAFDGVAIEYIFVEKRIYEEMIIFRSKEEKFSDIKWRLKEQYSISDAGRYFDKLVFEVTAISDADWEELKLEYYGPMGCDHPNFDAAAHEAKRQTKMVRLTREYWFDITSIY